MISLPVLLALGRDSSRANWPGRKMRGRKDLGPGVHAAPQGQPATWPLQLAESQALYRQILERRFQTKPETHNSVYNASCADVENKFEGKNKNNMFFRSARTRVSTLRTSITRRSQGTRY